MAKVSIRLAILNSTGSVASIEDNEGNMIDLVIRENRRDAKSICLKASEKLRKLADDFERLSVMEDPFKEKTQRAASKLQKSGNE